MSTPALQLHDVRKSFGRTSIINGVNLSIGAGERHAIIGPNGAGKSTLFNLISGRFGVTSGQIDLHGESITGLEPEIINRKGLARSFQITNIFPRMSVYENVRCAVLWSQGYKYSFWHRVDALNKVRERTTEIVERIGMAKRRDRVAGVLTYAEQRALEIGVTIAGGANVHPARRTHRGHEPQRNRRSRRPDPQGDRRPHSDHGRARHECGIQPG